MVGILNSLSILSLQDSMGVVLQVTHFFFLTFRHCLYIPLIHNIKSSTFLVRSHLKTSLGLLLPIRTVNLVEGWKQDHVMLWMLFFQDSSDKIILSHLKSGSHTFSSHSLHVSTCKTRMQFVWPLSNSQWILHSYLKLKNSCGCTYILAFWISTIISNTLFL